MNTNLILAGALSLAVAGTGCATKNYVAKTMAPVEARVTTAEGMIADQDKKLTSQSQEIGELQTHLSRSDEKISDADSKAQRAGESAEAAQKTALEASAQANNAMTAANNGRDQAIAQVNDVARKMESSLKMKMAGSETVLFATNQYTLNDEAKEALNSFAEKLHGKDRFLVEVQGFTDKTGSPQTNEMLSQKRAEAVARYLVNEHQIPLHQVTTLGSGYAQAIGDDSTRDGRKQNRRVEVRLFTPETASLSAAAR